MPAFPDQPTDTITAALGSVPTGTAVSAVAKRLLELFTSGAIPRGARLPPERQLAQSLGIGRSAVREALAALEILGIIDVRPGSGTYLRGSASELLPETLSWGLMLGEPRTDELIALRGRLEIFAAELAATQIGDDALTRLDRHLTAMHNSLGNHVRFIEADLKFHLEIAASAGNQVLSDLLRSIRSLLRIWVERGLSSDDEAQAALAEHAEVLAALRARDPRAAAAAMTRHMDTAGARLRLTITPTAD
ncbi:FadR/GntR family transcriptional regulator [Leifsonia poae]|uniref:FadR/GntR family transcriptional regulator n=1 Tax=Leifsonia poae TaxID=110933 RepID=UPI001CBE173A|nr:FCD domain-containing protein [Leifsonia poae]